MNLRTVIRHRNKFYKIISFKSASSKKETFFLCIFWAGNRQIIPSANFYYIKKLPYYTLYIALQKSFIAFRNDVR